MTLAISAFVQGLVSVVFPASAEVLRGRGLTDAQYGSIFLPQTALAATGALGAGLVLDRLGAKRALVLGFALMALSQAALACVPGAPAGALYPLTVAGTALLGLGAGVSAGPLNAYPQALFPARGESAVVALHTVVGVGLAATPVLAGAAIDHRAWLAVPLALASACVALVVVLDRLRLPEPEAPRRARRERSAPVGAVRLFVGIALLYGITEAVYGNWGIVYLAEERRLGVATAGLAVTAFWAAITASRFAVAAALLRLAPQRVLPALAGAMALSCALVPLARSGGAAVLVFAGGGVGCSAVFPLAVGLAGRRFPDDRAGVASALYAALVGGQAIGSAATGLLRPWLGLATIYPLAGIPPVLAAVLAVRATSQSNNGSGTTDERQRTTANEMTK